MAPTSEVVSGGKTHPLRLSWPALIAALIAMYAMDRSLGFSPLLPVLAVALIASRFVPYRFGGWAHWPVRIAFLAVIILLNLGSFGQNPEFLIDLGTMQALGLVCVTELVLQAWIKHGDRGSLGVVIFLSGLVFLLGCTTWQFNEIRVLAPIYMLFAIVSLTGFRSAQTSIAGHPMASASILRAGAIALALGAGALTYGGFWTYRSQLTAFGDNFMQNRRVPEEAGVSTNPVLGDSFGVQGSPNRVLRIVGPLSDGHLRALAFDTYVRGAWEPRLGGRSFVPVGPDTLGGGSPGLRAQITCLAESAGLIYAPLGSAAISPPVGSFATWSPSTGAAVRTSAFPPYTYTVTAGRGSFAQGPLCIPPTQLEKQRCLAIPQGIDPGVRAFAVKIGAGRRTAASKVAGVIVYLQSHYSYSLTIHPGPGDPVSNFLLHRKAAYCEYFASAAAILLRYLGVPTRYVVGYYAHESDGPNVTVVRQWDAHAWAESWIDGVGWVTVDATPADGRPDGLDYRVPFWTRAWEWIEDHEAALRARLSRLSPAEILVAVAGLALAATLARWVWMRGWLAWRRARRRRVEFRYSGPPGELKRLAARFAAHMSRCGVACPADRTWTDCLRDIPEGAAPTDIPIDCEAAFEFIERYNEARFGGDAGDAAALDSLAERLDTMEKPR